MVESVKAFRIERTDQVINLARQLGEYVATVILAIVDYAMVVLALLTAWQLRSVWLLHYFSNLNPLPVNGTMIYFIIPFAYFLFIAYSGLYTKRLPFWKSAEVIFKICVYVNVLTIVCLYGLGSIEMVSRVFVALSGLFCFVYLCVGRWGVKKLLIYSSLWQKPVIIIGAGKTAELLAQSFSSDPGLGYKIIGLIEDCSTKERPLLKQYTHLGGFDEAEQTIQQSGVQDVILAVPGIERSELLDMVYRIQPYVRNLTIVPDLFGVPLSNMEVETLFNEKTVMLKVQNNMSLLRNRVSKRVFDLCGSIFGGLLIAPIFIVIAIAIYISDPGPIFFAHRRLGANGEYFSCYKFRSMIINSQVALAEYLANNPAARAEWAQDFKLKDDPRVTRVGKFLRKTSLDELPQLFNVIKGEMSLVGPRPIVKDEVVKYGKHINDYYLVRPGMTGYWQVSGRNDVDYDRRVRMDSWYVRNWSLWQDIVLLMKTVNVVLGRKGAY